MVPLELRVKRSAKLQRTAPDGCEWCAGCQSWRETEDFRHGEAREHTRCWACRSDASHGARVEKVYGLTPAQYDALLQRQGGRCAICRARPKSKRLAVDHDHKSGAVRGLLCSRCNHDLLGSAWDSIALASALWHYLNTPPAAGSWRSPEEGQGGIEQDAAPQAARDDLSASKPLPLVGVQGDRRPALSAALARAADNSAAPYPPLVPLYAELDRAVTAAAGKGKARELVAAIEALRARGLLTPPGF